MAAALACSHLLSHRALACHTCLPALRPCRAKRVLLDQLTYGPVQNLVRCLAALQWWWHSSGASGGVSSTAALTVVACAEAPCVSPRHLGPLRVLPYLPCRPLWCSFPRWWRGAAGQRPGRHWGHVVMRKLCTLGLLAHTVPVPGKVLCLRSSRGGQQTAAPPPPLQPSASTDCVALQCQAAW